MRVGTPTFLFVVAIPKCTQSVAPAAVRLTSPCVVNTLPHSACLQSGSGPGGGGGGGGGGTRGSELEILTNNLAFDTEDLNFTAHATV